MTGRRETMIQRVDLARNYRNHKEEYLKAIQEVCEETAFSGGKYADRFEEEFAEYIGVRAASAVDNGTSALQLAMLALGIGEGDEVIVPANTYIATAWGPTYTGAVPVFVDCTPDTWQIDPEAVEAAVTERTKAIIGVHLYGQPFDYDRIREIADRHHLYVVEDCAQSHGARYRGRMTGSMGELGCFSFYPGKNLYAFGEGGCVTSNDPSCIEAIHVMKNQGCKVRYYHDVVGFNMRLEGIQGAVLSVSLKYLDQWTARRQEIGWRYLKEITNPLFGMQAHPEDTEPVFHLFVMTVEDPEHFIGYMEEQGIQCHRHYPVPCHLQKAYAHLGYQQGDCPNAEQLADHCVSLPMFPELTDEEAEAVIRACNAYGGKDHS